MVGTRNGQPVAGGVNLTDPARPAFVEVKVLIPAEVEPVLRDMHQRSVEVRKRLQAAGRLPEGEVAESLTWDIWIDKALQAGVAQAAAELEKYEKAVGTKLIVTPEEARRSGLIP